MIPDKSKLNFLLAKQKELEAQIEEERKRVQSVCRHMHVSHWDGHYASGYVTFPIRRCLDCGVVEIGGWWCYDRDCTHWHDRDDYDKSILGYHPDRVVSLRREE